MRMCLLISKMKTTATRAILRCRHGYFKTFCVAKCVRKIFRVLEPESNSFLGLQYFNDKLGYKLYCVWYF